MKASKFIVLAAGVLGILAFFLPMVTVDDGDMKASVSAFQIIKGVDALEVSIDNEAVKAAHAGRGEVASALSSEAKEGLAALKGIVMAVFVPALVLLFVGGLGVMRKKFGRVAGTFSLIFGLIGLGIGALLSSAAEGDGGIGLTLLLLTGVVGVIGGLIALVKPDRGLAAAAA